MHAPIECYSCTQPMSLSNPLRYLTRGSANHTHALGQGIQFGPSDVSVTVQIGFSVCGTSSWCRPILSFICRCNHQVVFVNRHSNTVMRCRIDPSSQPSQQLGLTISFLVGTRIAFFTFDSPVLSIAGTLRAKVKANRPPSKYS